MQIAAWSLCMAVATPALAAEPDATHYATLLEKYVKNGVVDYNGFKSEEKELDRYLGILEKTDTGKLDRNEKFAFYVNAYNAWTIKLILTGYPGVKSIKDLGNILKSPWKKKICRIDGKTITLDDIEHNILRPVFKDPRVHFAIVCASKSCPPLKSEPFRANGLDTQLDDAAKGFINNPENNRLEGTTLYASRIFDWFAGDFDKDIVGFFLKYAQGDLKTALGENRDKIKVRFLEYDWSLNGK